MMKPGSHLLRHTGRFSLIACAIFSTISLTACGHSTPAPSAVAPVQAASVPSIVGNWTGTQQGLVDVNKTPFQFTAQFLDNGTFTLTGNWQGMNGPAGQSMAGTYTQSGPQVSIAITHNQALAAGQTLDMPGYSTSAKVGADGKSIDIGHGAAEYVLTRS